MAYIADGFRTDCQNIIDEFAQLKSIRYDAFTKIWRDRKFSFVYFGHGTFDELVEFTGEAIRIAKEMWLKSETLNEQAGGLYLLYGLYLKQPTDGFIKVRLTPNDCDLVEKFREEVRIGGHHDANYVLARMHLIGAFRFCISEHPYGIEKSFRRYHECDRTLCEAKNEPFFIKRLKNDRIFLKLDEALKQYYESKCKLVSEEASKPSQVLDYVDCDFGQTLKTEFQKIASLTKKSAAKSNNKVVENTNIKPDDKQPSTANKQTFTLPWWMVPVRNRCQKDSSSEGEPDNSDLQSHIPQRRRSKRLANEILSSKFGMSCEEEEEDEDEDEDKHTNVKSQEVDFTAKDSHDMPLI